MLPRPRDDTNRRQNCALLSLLGPAISSVTFRFTPFETISRKDMSDVSVVRWYSFTQLSFGDNIGIPFSSVRIATLGGARQGRRGIES